MANYKGIRCFQCDSIILANMPHVSLHPSGDARLRTLHCPECSVVTLQMHVCELRRYSMPPEIRKRGYARKGEWGELAS